MSRIVKNALPVFFIYFLVFFFNLYTLLPSSYSH